MIDTQAENHIQSELGAIARAALSTANNLTRLTNKGEGK